MISINGLMFSEISTFDYLLIFEKKEVLFTNSGLCCKIKVNKSADFYERNEQLLLFTL